MPKPSIVVIDPELLARAQEMLGLEATRAVVEKAVRDAIWHQEQIDAIKDIASMDLEPNPVKVHIEP